MEYEYNRNYGESIIQKAPQLYIDLDVEADGVAGRGSLLSVGAVSPWGDTFYRELKPASKLFIPENRQFCEEHGLERKRLKREGMDSARAMAELALWTNELREHYGKETAVMAAFNASYDFPLINEAYLRTNQKNPFGIAGFCTKSLVAALVPYEYDWSKTRKKNLPADITPPGDFTHHALEDAVYQQQLHFATVGYLTTEKERDQPGGSFHGGWGGTKAF